MFVSIGLVGIAWLKKLKGEFVKCHWKVSMQLITDSVGMKHEMRGKYLKGNHLTPSIYLTMIHVAKNCYNSIGLEK